jgi:ribosomal protein S18 acetylase RimI-like enzyme
VTLTLRPMTEDEFGPWFEQLHGEYEQQLIDFAQMSPKAAREKARRDHDSLLGEHGLATEGHSVYVLDDDGATVGDLWLAEQERGGGRFLWIYYIRVDAERRGQGYGKQAMRLAEEEARRRGLPELRLNVWGGNEVARSLYRSLEYSEDSVWMSKAV